MFEALPKSKAEAATELTYMEGEKSIDKVFAAEKAYQALDDAAKGDLATQYATFGDTLKLAKDLDTIAEMGKIEIENGQVDHFIILGELGDIPEYKWRGLDGIDSWFGGSLETVYQLKLEIMDQTYIEYDKESDRIKAIAVTGSDALVQIYGSGANALRELAAIVTYIVLPEQDTADIGNTAYFDFDIIPGLKFNKQKNDHEFYVQYAIMPVLSVGKQECRGVSGYPGTTVEIVDPKVAALFEVSICEGTEYGEDNGATLIGPKLGVAKADIKKGTYRSQLRYSIPLSGNKSVVVTTNEVKLVVLDKTCKRTFKTATINTFYYDTEATTTSHYWPVELEFTNEWNYDTIFDYTFENIDDDSPFYFTYTYDDYSGGGTWLNVKPGVTLDKSRYKATFRSGDYEDTDANNVALPINCKKMAPKNLVLDTKTYNIPQNENLNETIYLRDAQYNLLNGMNINGIEIATTNSIKYPYQNLFVLDHVVVDEDEGDIYGMQAEIRLKDYSDMPASSSFSLLLSVTFDGSKNTLDLPLKINRIKPKVSLLQKSVILNEPVEGKESAAYVGYKYSNIARTAMLSYTVNGIADTDPAAALPINIEYDTVPINRFKITPTANIEYGKKHKVILLFDNGQKLSLNVNTKSTANKLKLGKSGFTMDLANPNEKFQTSLTTAYIKDSNSYTLKLDYYDVENKRWNDDTSSIMTAQWIDHSMVVFTPGSELAVGKTKFRVYAPDQGIEAAKGAAFTATVANGKLKLSATIPLAKMDVCTDNALVLKKITLSNTSNQDLEKYVGEDFEWYFTVGGDGAKYFEVLSPFFDNGAGALISWKNLGSYAMKQNGLKPIKLTLQLREISTNKLIAETKTYTIKLTQKTYAFSPATRVIPINLYRSIPYYRGTSFMGIYNLYKYGNDDMSDALQVKSVSIKNQAMSNYRVWLTGTDEYGNALIAIGYQNVEAAQKAKNSETITLLVELVKGVVPMEVKVKINNIK